MPRRWGRVKRVRIFEQTKNPNSRSLKREYYDDGDRKNYDIDFDIRGSVMEKISSPNAVSIPVDTAEVTIYNLAETGDATGDREISVGDMIEVSAGHRELENEAAVFLGVIVKIKPAMDGNNRKTTIIANDGTRYWLGHPVINQDYIRVWELWDDQFVDTDPWTATQIARDVVEAKAGLKFYSGGGLDAAAPATDPGGGGAIDDLLDAATRLPGAEQVLDQVEGLINNATDAVNDTISGAVDSALGAVEDTVGGLLDSLGVDIPLELPFDISDLLGEDGEKTGDQAINNLEVSVAQLATEGKFYLHGKSVYHTPYGALTHLAYESGFWAHKLYLGEVYWNPQPSMAALQTGFTLNGKTGILKRTEYIEEGRIRNEPHAEKVTNEREEAVESFADFFVTAELDPIFGPAKVFKLQDEIFGFSEILSGVKGEDFTTQAAPEAQVFEVDRQDFDGHVQIKEYRFVAISKSDTFDAYMKVKAI